VTQRTIHPSRRLVLAHAAALGAGLFGGKTFAQDAYPFKPVRIIVGFGPGSAPDLLVRLLGFELGKRIGQPVVIENRPGAAANIAADAVAKSPADGYTLFYGTNTTHAINPSLYPKLPFDHIRDFEPIILTGKVWNVLLVNPSSTLDNFRTVVAIAKTQPGKLSIGSSGNGTSLHLTAEMLKHQLGLNIVHVPYKTSEASMIDVAGGRLDMVFANVPPALPHIQSGRLRAIAITSLERSPQLPMVATLHELGLKDFEVCGWGGFFAPSGIARQKIELLHGHLKAILQDPAVVNRLSGWGVTAQTTTPREFGDFVKAETMRWREVIRVSGAKLD
jgi:tripartite-type tricarboxylate transporter receptor subunit TctC